MFTGRAEIINRFELPENVLDRYDARYREGMTGIQMTRPGYEAGYTVPIRFTPEKLRGR
jgi:hypothetical protein